MKLHVDELRLTGLTGLAVLLAGCGAADARVASTATPIAAERSIAKGPAADYPVVLGEPFMIDGVTYTPNDSLNVDEVGYATGDAADTPGITASHRTLPLPSYVEVTALDTGRTALVRVERRGPMTNDRLIALSPGALAQLGIADGAPVRARRVNPLEADRAELREGREAPLRMDTPAGLLEVLKRKLPATGSTSLRSPVQERVSGHVPTPGEIKAIDPDPVMTTPAVAPAPAVEPAATPVELPPQTSTPAPGPAVQLSAAHDSSTPAKTGQYAIQVGAFTMHQNAEKLAHKLNGYVMKSGQLSLVRAGPYSSRGQAAQALAKLRGDGYRDARIVTLK